MHVSKIVRNVGRFAHNWNNGMLGCWARRVRSFPIIPLLHIDGSENCHRTINDEQLMVTTDSRISEAFQFL